MLNWNEVLRYVKMNLSLPSTFIEYSDEELKDYLVETALQEFSTYFPDVARTTVIADNSNYKVDGFANRWFIFDEEELPIIGLIDVYMPLGQGSSLFSPWTGAMSVSGYQYFALSSFNSSMFAGYSPFATNFQFYEPNVIEILPYDSFNLSFFTVEYERNHPSDLSKIPKAMYMTFKDIALAHAMLMVGNMRSTYGDDALTTPYGSIPLQGGSLRDRGEALRTKMVDLLRDESLPPVNFDVF